MSTATIQPSPVSSNPSYELGDVRCVGDLDAFRSAISQMQLKDLHEFQEALAFTWCFSDTMPADREFTVAVDQREQIVEAEIQQRPEYRRQVADLARLMRSRGRR